ncbi:EfeM/EfeO family lipoprotein [Actinomycetospora cinnamomea]|uniref:Iron uptake system component EfeO n=1 Tax=Actinomycetospora cinnamomea TaxID=663609 RepID=A0A2U1EWE0_9PSEU|nr:EfeM/EfeO family lipoprotein [Actinomycetospora cinnamomea]PVZ04242.1 iron uptake system component EfeO [Actinomycetospora cinnamomea]
MPSTGSRQVLPLVGVLGAAVVVLAACGGAPPAPPAPAAPAAAPAAPDRTQMIDQAVAQYEDYVRQQVADTVAGTRVLTDAVRAGDLEAAKAAFAPSRVGWERIEPIAGLVEEIDGAVDARVDDFAGVEDPEFTGWHRIEYILWEQGQTAAAVPFADQLDADLQTLDQQIRTLRIPALDMARGSAELIEEVSQGKITGEEDRYSKTDLSDFQANIDGSVAVIGFLRPALQASRPAVLPAIDQGFADVDAGLASLRRPDGSFVPYCQENDEYPSPLCPAPTVTTQQVDTFKVQLAGLSEDVAMVPGVLGLQ